MRLCILMLFFFLNRSPSLFLFKGGCVRVSYSDTDDIHTVEKYNVAVRVVSWGVRIGWVTAGIGFRCWHDPSSWDLTVAREHADVGSVGAGKTIAVVWAFSKQHYYRGLESGFRFVARVRMRVRRVQPQRVYGEVFRGALSMRKQERLLGERRQFPGISW